MYVQLTTSHQLTKVLLELVKQYKLKEKELLDFSVTLNNRSCVLTVACIIESVDLDSMYLCINRAVALDLYVLASLNVPWLP